MAATRNFASDLIATGASGYATAAAHALLERDPGIAERFGQGSYRSWSRHLTERSLELAAAILVEEPALFAAEVGWARFGFDSREVPIDDLRSSLECLRDALREELPEPVRTLPDPYFEAAFARLDEPAPERGPLTDGEGPEAKLALQYLEALLTGRRRRAIDLVLSAVDDGMPVEAAYSDVLGAAQRMVGEMWHAHELSVAQEHFVTATTEAVMTLLGYRTAPAAGGDHTVVVALAPGNSHCLGARALSHLFEKYGWNAIYLGSDMPATEAAIALEAFDADLLALSIAMSVQVRSALHLVRSVRQERPGIKILVGGRVVSAVPELWRKIDGDGSAVDAAQAIDVARELVAS